MPKLRICARSVTLLLLVLLVTACATPSPPPAPVVVQPARIPPLPQEARQPTPPSDCSPTCSAGLTRLRSELQNMLTPPAPPAEPASGPMMR